MKYEHYENNNSGINNAKFVGSKLGKYIETNLENKGIVEKEYLSYPEPCEWVLDNGYILNEAMMYEMNEEIILEQEQKDE